MDREAVIRMAREAGFTESDISLFPDLIVHFAARVVEQEREACARICLKEAPTLDGQLCADAIRART